MAKDLAKAIGYTYIDTGAMYRAVTLYALRHQLFAGDQIDEAALQAALPALEIAFRMNAESGRPDTCGKTPKTKLLKLVRISALCILVK